MKNKVMTFSAIALVVFLLVTGTSLAVNATTKPQKSAEPTPELQVFLEREQQYQQLVNEANQKIALANEQLTQLSNSPVTQEPTTQPYLFNEEQASKIAENLAQEPPSGIPELVDFSGTPAFEVLFDTNNITGKVYVDANTGAVLYNGLARTTVASLITTDQAVQIAVNYLGGGTVTGVNFSEFNGETVYIVSFSNGQTVFVSLYGEVKAIQMASAGGSNEPEDDDDDDDDDD
jgi:uncharacterized membrane protein YkoI